MKPTQLSKLVQTYLSFEPNYLSPPTESPLNMPVSATSKPKQKKKLVSNQTISLRMSNQFYLVPLIVGQGESEIQF